MTITPIAFAHNGYKQKFGIPRQSGCAASVLTRIVFAPEYRIAEALRGIEQWSHLWLIWGFSENIPTANTHTEGTNQSNNEQPLFGGYSPTVRPPRLGGNTRIGVFATRSPFRPNGLGLSSVKIEKIEKTANEGTVIVVSGADLMDGTPIYDIKPYLPYTDIHEDATSGFAEHNTNYQLQVIWAKGTKKGLSSALIQQLTEILREDPRPAYKTDSEQEYGLTFNGYNVWFTVNDKILEIIRIKNTDIIS